MGTVIRIGELTINLDRRAVEVNDRPLHLTGMEYAILELLSLHKGVAVTREMLLDHLYGEGNRSKINSLRVLISNVRRKIARATGGARYIHTLGHRGYVLKDPPESRSAGSLYSS
jgi:two-component system cell cycle response regulator CtrA